MQLDVFHSLMDLGVEVSKKERQAISILTEYYSLESKVNGKKVHKKTLDKYYQVSGQIKPCLSKADTVNILFSWLREHIGFSGYGYAKSMELCNWILDEMVLAYPEHKKFINP